ncbi:MAG: hypothetical protein ACLR23_25545 [Clostridia bacterium]
MKASADLHCDTLLSVLTQNGLSPEHLWRNQGHLDLTRLLGAGAAIQFFAIFYRPRRTACRCRWLSPRVSLCPGCLPAPRSGLSLGNQTALAWP